MNPTINQRLRNGKRRIERRLHRADLRGCAEPMFTASNIHSEISGRARGLAHGGIGAFHLLARKLGLIDRIDERLHLLKVHLPYHESDHVLNLAYNALCDGSCLQDLERRRQDENFLDALGARRLPDPTTAGDFCRRFTPASIGILQDVFDDTRVRAWAGQPAGAEKGPGLESPPSIRPDSRFGLRCECPTGRQPNAWFGLQRLTASRACPPARSGL